MLKPTKVLVEEGQGSQVAGQAEELRHHHQPVPGTDGQRHHQQLRQDERCKRDGHHVHKLGLEQHQCTVHEDATWWHQLKWVSIFQETDAATDNSGGLWLIWWKKKKSENWVFMASSYV